MMTTQASCRRLAAEDVEIFQTLRLQGFRLEPRAFRYAPEDESNLPRSEAAARFERDYVLGAFHKAKLVGIGGVAWSGGAKTHHKALLYGMYVEPAHRGAGAANEIMRNLMAAARRRVEIVLLTVVSDNLRARRFYERWGFRAYGEEKRAIRIAEDDYLDETLMARDFRRAPSDHQVFIESKKP